MKLLLIDIGNSAFKWRYADQAGMREGGCLHAGSWQSLPDAWRVLSPDAIWLASVVGEQATQSILALLAAQFDCPLHHVRAGKQLLGVQSGYQQPLRLGVDRWLGVVEGFQRVGACIVIDAGSAITLDAVTASGQHLGGYILPGLAMMEQALLGATAEVVFDVAARESTVPGTTTQQAVQNGVLMMAAAGIERAIVAFQKQLQDTGKILVTGGDAAVLVPHLRVPVVQVSNLVLASLERLASNNTGV